MIFMFRSQKKLRARIHDPEINCNVKIVISEKEAIHNSTLRQSFVETVSDNCECVARAEGEFKDGGGYLPEIHERV